MSLLHHLLPTIAWLVYIISGEPALAKVPALFVFGDSTVDTGNNNYISTIVKSDFAPYGRDLRLANGRATGRFSNGRLAIDFISEAFGLPPLVPAYLDRNVNISSLATGACFASAGAGYDNATSDLFSVLSVWKQLDYFKEYAAKLRRFQGDAKAQETLSEALYVVSVGTNDFLENYYAVPQGHAARHASSASEYGAYLLGVAGTFARALHALGARKLDLNGLPPMGCLPLERRAADGGACDEEYNSVARSFNAGLRDLAARLDGGGGGARVVYGDVYSGVADALADPAAFGFEDDDVSAGCCGVTGRFEVAYLCNAAASPLTCADAGKYAFWDAIHPTEHLHRVIADRKMNTSLYVFL